MRLSLFGVIPFCFTLYNFYNYYLLGINKTGNSGWYDLYSHASLYLWILFMSASLSVAYLLILALCVILNIKQEDLGNIDRKYINYGWIIIIGDVILNIGQLFVGDLYIK